MADVINAILSLAKRDIIDWIAILSPIILSVIAVWIAISTSIKQNKISLFEKRLESYFEVSRLLLRWEKFAEILLNVTKSSDTDSKSKIYNVCLTALSFNLEENAILFNQVEQYIDGSRVNHEKVDEDMSLIRTKGYVALEYASIIFSKNSKKIIEFRNNYYEFTNLVFLALEGDKTIEELKLATSQFKTQLQNFNVIMKNIRKTMLNINY